MTNRKRQQAKRSKQRPSKFITLGAFQPFTFRHRGEFIEVTVIRATNGQASLDIRIVNPPSRPSTPLERNGFEQGDD